MKKYCIWKNKLDVLQNKKPPGFPEVNCYIFGCLSANFKNTNPKAKNIVKSPTAKLIVPPANLTPAITAEPKKEAPLEKIS